MKVLKLVFLGISLGIIAFAITSGAYKLPGQIAGTVANPLLIDNKFCSDPASPNQTGCVSFISSALAQTMSSPYQNVSGPVSISGNVDISGNVKLGASRTNSALVWDFGHKIGREASDGSLKIGGGQANINLLNKTTLFFTDNGGTGNNPSIYINQGGTSDARIGFEIRGVTGWEVGIDNSDGDKFKISNSTGVGDFTATGLTIDTTGSVGIGTASPGYKLDVSGDIRSTGTIYANANGTSYLCGGDDACLADINVGNTVGIKGRQNSGGWGYVNAAGFNTQSSRRFKTNIRNSRYGLDAVLALQGVDFSYIDPNQAQDATGFIAEDVAGIYPYAVQYDNGLASNLDYSKFAPLFVNAIKEQQKQITSLFDIIDYVNKIGRFIQVETQKLIVSGVDILEKLNSLSQKIEAQQKEIDLLKQEIETLKAR